MLSKQSAIIYLFSPARLRLRARGAGKAARAAHVQPHAVSSAPGRQVPGDPGSICAVLTPVCVLGREKKTPTFPCVERSALPPGPQDHKKRENPIAEVGECFAWHKEEPVACERYLPLVWGVREGCLCEHTQVILLRHVGEGWETNYFGLHESCFSSLASAFLSVKWAHGLSAQESAWRGKGMKAARVPSPRACSCG